ncbi:hypothetical protein DNK44_05010 [Pseudomonas dryadis]|uniref:Short-chain dehydrogenase n=2 Tax=Phytopseudomonas dryadis TaxID=2487520 RepID=A0A4Q9R6C2_9GAMM|nr:hypothetical protein DNK44_05010 [Pseudomonas dryadis]
MTMIDYRGKQVLISGAGSGIDRGLARAFAEQGATLELLDRDAEALARVADELAQILAVQAVPELLTPADLAGTFLFLGSSLAAPVTGQALSVSHGEVMH